MMCRLTEAVLACAVQSRDAVTVPFPWKMSNFVAKNRRNFSLLWGGIFLVLTEGASLRFDQMFNIGRCTRFFLGWPANGLVHVRN